MTEPITDVNEFLLKSFRHYHFHQMPPAVRAHFDKISQESDYIGNMKKWSKWFFDQNGQELTAPEIDDANLKKLYDIFQKAIQNMASHASDLRIAENSVALGFIDTYFGNGKLFSTSTATQPADDYIQNTLLHIIEKYKNLVVNSLQDYGVFSADFSVEDLIKGIKDKKYNSDLGFQSKLRNFVNSLSYAQSSSEWVEKITQDPSCQIDLSSVGNPETWFVNANYDQDLFRQNLPILFNTLLTKPKIKEPFLTYDSSGKIKTQLEQAIADTDWANEKSDDYITPQVAEELSLKQEIEKKLDKTYKDFFRQFTSLRGRRRFVSPYIEEIIDAIDANKIKPTDGLDAIIKKADDIKKKLKHNNAGKHFDWFVKQMSSLQKLMPKTFADDPLKHGKKLQDIVSQMIVNAVNDGKEEEAKTAMEILSIVKYGYTTSRTMDALQNTDFSIIGDKGLSWNKNEGVQFVTNAMDKTAKFALVGTGRLLAMARNTYERNRTKFKGQPNKNLSMAIDGWKQQNDQEKNAAQQVHNINITNWNNTINDNNKKLNDLSAGHGQSGHSITSGNVNTLKNTQLVQLESDKKKLQAQYDTAQLNFNTADEVYQHNERLKNDIEATDKEITKLKDDIASLDTQISTINALSRLTPEQTAERNLLVKERYELRQKLNVQQTQLAEQQAKQQKYETASTNATHLKNWTNLKSDCDNKKTLFDDALDKYNKLQSDVQSFENKTQSNQECQRLIDESTRKMANWPNDKLDKCRQLMAHWDFLETGSMVSKFHLGQERMNKKFARNKDMLIQQIYDKYDYSHMAA